MTQIKCIFKHSFLKWTVGEKITNRLFTGPVTVSHKCKIIDKLQQTKQEVKLSLG